MVLALGWGLSVIHATPRAFTFRMRRDVFEAFFAKDSGALARVQRLWLQFDVLRGSGPGDSCL